VIKDLDIATNFTDLYEQEGLLMAAEFKLSINAYLSDLLYSPVRSLAQVIAFNEAHPVEVNQIVLFLSSTYFQDIYDQMMLFPVVLVLQERLKDFGQPNLIAAEKTNGIGTRERAAIQRLKEISTNGLEKLMKEHQLDANRGAQQRRLLCSRRRGLSGHRRASGVRTGRESPLRYALVGSRATSQG